MSEQTQCPICTARARENEELRAQAVALAALRTELEEQRKRYDDLWKRYEGCVNGGEALRWAMKEAGEHLMRASGLAGCGIIRLIEVPAETLPTREPVSTEHWLRETELRVSGDSRPHSATAHPPEDAVDRNPPELVCQSTPASRQ